MDEGSCLRSLAGYGPYASSTTRAREVFCALQTPRLFLVPSLPPIQRLHAHLPIHPSSVHSVSLSGSLLHLCPDPALAPTTFRFPRLHLLVRVAAPPFSSLLRPPLAVRAPLHMLMRLRAVVRTLTLARRAAVGLGIGVVVVGRGGVRGGRFPDGVGFVVDTADCTEEGRLLAQWPGR